MVGDEKCAIIPNKCVVCIFQLIRNKKDRDPLRFWSVGKHSTLVRNWHSILFSSNYGINNVLHHMSRSPSKIGNDNSSETINADVPSQNLSTGFIFQYRVEILGERSKTKK